jgi:Flp pilus assembly protein TadD
MPSQVTNPVVVERPPWYMLKDLEKKRLPKSCAILILLWLTVASSMALEAANSSIILIFPPENLTKNQDLAWIGEGIALSIGEQMSLPGVECIGREERLRLLEAADLPPNTPLSDGSMMRLAQQAAAAYLIIGYYSGKQDSIKVTLRVFDLKALKFWGDISATGPHSALPQIENELAWIILSSSGLNKAISRQKFVERTRQIPNQPYSLYIKALSLILAEERTKMMERAVSSYGDIPDARYRIGSHYYERSDCMRAIPHLEAARRRQNYFLDCQFMLGTCYLQQNLLDEAIRAYEAVISFGQYPEVLNNLGVTFLRKKDLPLAAQNLVAARNLDKSDASIAFNLALLRYQENNFEAAATLLDECDKIQPGVAAVKRLAALVSRALGHAGEAESSSSSAKRLAPDESKNLGEEPLSWARISHARPSRR